MARYLTLGLLLSLCLTACKVTPQQDAFVTMLGGDTLAVETFLTTPDSIMAKVVLRTPKTSLRSYLLKLGDDKGIEELIVFNHNPAAGFSDKGSVVQRMVREGDSLKIETTTAQGFRTNTIGYRDGTLPFIDMVHWPFDVALQAAKASGRDTTHQFLVSGNSLSDFIIAKITEDSMSIRHPFRGVMGTRISSGGDLLFLDAAGTTRKLKVHRQIKTDIDAIAARYAAEEASGKTFGELSGAQVLEKNVLGANIRVEYGTPQMRNREIFGSLVPWGEVWRTGANRATHFYTDKNLRFGNVTLPSGEYTLFTVPEADGGVLIINKETNQNGNSYNPDYDFARIPMKISDVPDSVESFTIDLEQAADTGVLKLMWDKTVFSVEFRIL